VIVNGSKDVFHPSALRGFWMTVLEVTGQNPHKQPKNGAVMNLAKSKSEKKIITQPHEEIFT
jgi:hypothetical protein